MNEELKMKLESLKTDVVYNSRSGLVMYDGNGGLDSINARCGDPRIKTGNTINVQLLESMTPCDMTPEEFRYQRGESTRAVSEFYESTGIRP